MAESEDMDEDEAKLCTPEELRRLGQLLRTPIDFDQLIADGILRGTRRGWYQVLDWERLPEHARARMHGKRMGTDRIDEYQFR